MKKDEGVVKKKMEEQMKNLGHVCPKIQCVVDKGIGYCMRDCPEFPCEFYEERLFPIFRKIPSDVQSQKQIALLLQQARIPANHNTFTASECHRIKLATTNRRQHG